jgi:PAS domain S-box-containing protein
LEKKSKLTARLEELLATSPIPWWEWDLAQNSVTFNDLKVTNLGYDPAGFHGKGYEVFTSLVHPDDYERTMEAMRDYLSGRAPLYQIDYRIRDRQDRYHWYMDRGAAIFTDDTGKPRVLRGLVIDLGAQLKSEKAEHEILEMVRGSIDPFASLKKGMVLICSNCLKTRIGEDNWVPVAETFPQLAAAEVSHGICPSCVRLLYPDMADRILA